MWYLERMKKVLNMFREYLINEKLFAPINADRYVTDVAYLYSEAGFDILKTCTRYYDVADLIIRVKNKRRGKDGGPLKGTTVHHIATSTKVFFTWAARNELIDKNPLQFGHEFKKSPRPKPDFFDQNSIELKKVFSYPHNTLQEVVIYKLFYASGVRVSEMCGLSIKSLDLNSGTGTILEAKGGQYRTFYYDAETASKLKEHIESLNLHFPMNTALFINERGKRRRSNVNCRNPRP